MDISLFKNSDPLLFLEVFEDAVKSIRKGAVDWNFPKDGQPKLGNMDSVGWLVTNGLISLISVDAPCADVMTAVARTLGSPELVVFFQEKSFWEFALYVDQAPVINFSTAPAQWGEVDPSAYFGTAQDLAEIWKVPVERIERYMVDWGLTERWIEEYKVMSPTYLMRGQKAYPEDEYEYGKIYQGFDFIRALGGHLQDKKQFIVHLPPPQRIKAN